MVKSFPFFPPKGCYLIRGQVGNWICHWESSLPLSWQARVHWCTDGGPLTGCWGQSCSGAEVRNEGVRHSQKVAGDKGFLVKVEVV